MKDVRQTLAGTTDSKPTQKNLILKLYLQGFKVSWIAQAINRPYRQVYNTIRKAAEVY